MNGKEKCKQLKQIRKAIAEQNDIEYIVEECKHKGDCTGTCPKCEADVKYLENELKKKQMKGLAVASIGLVAIPIMLTGCTNGSIDGDLPDSTGIANVNEISGDISIAE